MHAKLLQLCPTLCNPMTVAHQASLSMEILQAITLEWVAIPSSLRLCMELNHIWI